MTNDEFEEYKDIIKGALDSVGFNYRLDIQHQHISGIDDMVLVSSKSKYTVIIFPNKQVFTIGCLADNSQWSVASIDLADPGSVGELGRLLHRILAPSPWATSK